MTSKAITNFVDTIILHFPPFRWDENEERAWAATIIRELAGFSDAVVERARSEIVRTRKDRRTPIPSECISACLDAKRWLEADQRKTELPLAEQVSVTWFDWTADRRKLARDLCSSPMGKEAAKGGWIGVLDAFCRKNARLPNPVEAEGCKRTAKEVDAAYEACVRGGWPFAATLEKMGADVMTKRQELVDRVLHGVVK